VRLFVAVELPEPVADAVAGIAVAARERLPPASWVQRENLHLTLAFLGEVDEPSAGALEPALARAVGGQAPIAARIEGAGCFPPRGAVRVVWLGVEPAPALAELAERVRAAARRSGVAFDDKPFRSHVTLARCRRPWPPATRELWGERAPRPPIELEVRSVALVESERSPAGSRYRRRARVELGAGA
jgi:2'-5' RNA ligase